MDMTRFEHVDDPGFIAVTGELRRWIKGLSTGDPVQPSATECLTEVPSMGVPVLSSSTSPAAIPSKFI